MINPKLMATLKTVFGLSEAKVVVMSDSGNYTFYKPRATPSHLTILLRNVGIF
jgi:hypothetical protein